MNRRTFYLGLAFASISGLTANAERIDVQFGCSTVNGTSCKGVGTTITMTGAAVVGAPGDYWNNVDSNGYPQGTPVALKTVAGVSEGQVAWTMSDHYVVNGGAFAGSAAFGPLMESYLRALGTAYVGGSVNPTFSVTFTGLTANTSYTLTALSEGDFTNHTAAFSVNGGATWMNTDGGPSTPVFIQGSNYVQTAVNSGSTGSITLQYKSLNIYEADLSGIQLEAATAAAPEPGTFGLGILAVGGSVLVRRRRRTND